MTYRQLKSINNMRKLICEFLLKTYGDNLIMWDSKKNLIYKGIPFKIKIHLNNELGYTIITKYIDLTSNGIVFTNKN